MPDCRKSHLILQKIYGGGPPDPPPALAPLGLGSGFRPLTGPPFPKFLDPPPLVVTAALTVASAMSASMAAANVYVWSAESCPALLLSVGWLSQLNQVGTIC